MSLQRHGIRIAGEKPLERDRVGVLLPAEALRQFAGFEVADMRSFDRAP